MKATALQTASLILLAGALAACTPGTALARGASYFGFGSGYTQQATGTSSANVQSAIQDVIQRGNAEQQQALSSGDPSVMADTATRGYLRELTQATQDLLDSGVTGINLLKLEWGPIAVNGSSATATTYETWSTTYSDGSTDQSRDENDYTLVQQNGSWKIRSDDHPDSGLIPAPSTTTSPDPSQQPAPNTPVSKDQSRNWAGYAATGGKFTSVSGTWTLPNVTTSTTPGTDAAWVGIGGVSSHDLIQAGTQETVTGTGRAQYQAWVETLPQYSQPVPLAVHPGDSVSVAIDNQGGNAWTINFTNNTTGATYAKNVTYASSLSSAEWIEEAPSSGRGSVLPLDNFGKVTFSGASATENGNAVNLTQAHASPITMIDGARQPLATTSGIDGSGAGFTVSRAANSGSTGVGTPFRVRPRIVIGF